MLSIQGISRAGALAQCAHALPARNHGLPVAGLAGRTGGAHEGAQVGGTELGLNWVGYAIHHAPGPMMIVWPTTEMARANSKQRIDPLIENRPSSRN
jgi:hypothetical protein